MKTILMSIGAEHNANIESGRKRAELRTRPPKCELPIRVFTYESGKRGRHKVTNEWICREMRTYTEGYYPSSLPDVACVPPSYIDKSTDNGKKDLTAMYISDLVIYDKPRELSDFIVPSKTGCCNEGKCRGCKYLDRGNGYNIEDDCNAKFSTDDYKPLRRPPQSWCYVEVSENGT